MEMADDLGRPCGLFPEERSSAGVDIEKLSKSIWETVRETRCSLDNQLVQNDFMDSGLTLAKKMQKREFKMGIITRTFFDDLNDAMNRIYHLIGRGLTPDERLLKRMLELNWTIREYQRCLQMPTKSRGIMCIESLWLTDEDWKIVDKLFQDLIFGAETVSTMGDTVVQDGSSRTSRDRSVAAASPGRAAVYNAFVFLTALLLSAVFQYLIGLLHKGGAKVHSSGSLEFRWKYISLVLFEGWYVWIKFRDVAPDSEQKPPPGIHRKKRKDASGKEFCTFEPRFKPSGSRGKYIYVGYYKSEDDATIVYQILAYYYGKDVPGELPLLNGLTYPIPCMTEEEQHSDPETKKKWARSKVKAIFEEYKGAREASRNSLTSDVSGSENMYTVLFGSGCPDASEVDSSTLGAQPSQLGNQNDDVDTVAPGTQGHMPDISVSDNGFGVANWSGLPDVGMVKYPRLESSSDPDCPAACGMDSGGIEAEAQPSQLGNQSDDLEPVVPSSFSPNGDPTTPGMQGHVPFDTSRDHVDGAANGAGVPDEEPLENQENNVITDDLSIRREVKELQRQQKLQQSLIHEQESRIQQQETQNARLVLQQQHHELQLQQQEFRIQQQETQISRLVLQQQHQELQNQQQESRIQQQETQISRLVLQQQHQELQNQQQGSRISELEGKIERLSNTEHARKRLRTGLYLT